MFDDNYARFFEDVTPLDYPYLNLMAGIIEQTAKDYLRALKKWGRATVVLDIIRTRSERQLIERFYDSDWGYAICLGMPKIAQSTVVKEAERYFKEADEKKEPNKKNALRRIRRYKNELLGT